MAGWIKMPLSMEVGLGPSDIVLDGDLAPIPLPQKGPEPPFFGPYLLRPNGWMNQDATWYGDRPRPRRLCVGWGSSSPSPKRGGERSPQYSAHVRCGQTAGWIKMSVGMQVEQRKRHCVRWRPSPPSPKGAQSSPNFQPISVVANRLEGSRCHLVWR